MEIAAIVVGCLMTAMLAIVGFAVRKLVETVGDLSNSVAKIVQWIECKNTECRDHWRVTHLIEDDVKAIKEECAFRKGKSNA
jgi:hypothetical protein